MPDGANDTAVLSVSKDGLAVSDPIVRAEL